MTYLALQLLKALTIVTMTPQLLPFRQTRWAITSLFHFNIDRPRLALLIFRYVIYDRSYFNFKQSRESLLHIGIVVEQPAVISIFTTRLRNFYLQVRCKDFLLPQTISVAVTIQPLPDQLECSGTQRLSGLVVLG